MRWQGQWHCWVAPQCRTLGCSWTFTRGPKEIGLNQWGKNSRAEKVPKPQGSGSWASILNKHPKKPCHLPGFLQIPWQTQNLLLLPFCHKREVRSQSSDCSSFPCILSCFQVLPLCSLCSLDALHSLCAQTTSASPVPPCRADPLLLTMLMSNSPRVWTIRDDFAMPTWESTEQQKH